MAIVLGSGTGTRYNWVLRELPIGVPAVPVAELLNKVLPAVVLVLGLI
jgi:hypothetical protein